MARPKRPTATYRPKRALERSTKKPARLPSGQNSEHWHQATFISVLRRINHPAARWCFAVPNGFLRSKMMRIRAWKEGMLTGVSDLISLVPTDTHHGFILEMKRRPNVVTKEQQEFLDAMAALGYGAYVAYDWQEALNYFCTHYGISIDLHFSV